MPSRKIVIASAVAIGLLAPIAAAQTASAPSPRTKTLLTRKSAVLNKSGPARPRATQNAAPNRPNNSKSLLNRVAKNRPGNEKSLLNRKSPKREPAGILDRPAPEYPKSEILKRKAPHTPADSPILKRTPPARAGRTLLNQKPPARSSTTLLDRTPPARTNKTLIPTGPARPSTFQLDRLEQTSLVKRRNRNAYTADYLAYTQLIDKVGTLVEQGRIAEAQKLFNEASEAQKRLDAANASGRRRIY